jgi:hypothetical protein
VLNELVITPVADDQKHCLESAFHGGHNFNFRAVEEHRTYVSLVKVMVIEKEMKHFVYARPEALLAFGLPSRSRIVDCQLREIEYQLSPNVGKF